MSIGLALVAMVISLPSSAQEQGPAGPPSPILKEVVQGMPKGEKQEVRVLEATVKPGDKTPFHTHRFPVTVYVLERVVIFYVSDPDTPFLDTLR